jgi:hypothetical protein
MEKLLRTLDFMLNKSANDDLIIARLEATHKHVAMPF